MNNTSKEINFWAQHFLVNTKTAKFALLKAQLNINVVFKRIYIKLSICCPSDFIIFQTLGLNWSIFVTIDPCCNLSKRQTIFNGMKCVTYQWNLLHHIIIKKKYANSSFNPRDLLYRVSILIFCLPWSYGSLKRKNGEKQFLKRVPFLEYPVVTDLILVIDIKPAAISISYMMVLHVLKSTTSYYIDRKF